MAPSSLNPFVLWRESFRWSGRFTGRQLFAVVLSLGTFGVGVSLLLVATGLVTPDVPDSVSARALQVFVNTWLVVTVAAATGAVVRRLHDLGLSAWWVLLAFVPCLNAVFLLYVLFAPGLEGPDGPRAPFSVSALAKALAVTLGFGVLVVLSLPGVMRGRLVANENAAIGDLRALVAAQVGYSARNGEAYDSRWECLAQPATCLPGDTGPRLLDPDVLRSPRMGYLRELRSGPPAPRPPARSPTSTRGFVVVARPVSATAGGRTFCTDTSGRVCWMLADKSAGIAEITSEPEGVRCAPACSDLR